MERLDDRIGQPSVLVAKIGVLVCDTRDCTRTFGEIDARRCSCCCRHKGGLWPKSGRRRRAMRSGGQGKPTRRTHGAVIVTSLARVLLVSAASANALSPSATAIR